MTDVSVGLPRLVRSVALEDHQLGTETALQLASLVPTSIRRRSNKVTSSFGQWHQWGRTAIPLVRPHSERSPNKASSSTRLSSSRAGTNVFLSFLGNADLNSAPFGNFISFVIALWKDSHADQRWKNRWRLPATRTSNSYTTLQTARWSKRYTDMLTREVNTHYGFA